MSESIIRSASKLPESTNSQYPMTRLKHSVQAIAPFQGRVEKTLSGVISLEIGGSNGCKFQSTRLHLHKQRIPRYANHECDIVRGIQAAAWTQTPVIDADLMGRAYPNLWQTTLTRACIPETPCAVSDAKGNTLIHYRAASHQDVENFLRPLCSEMG